MIESINQSINKKSGVEPEKSEIIEKVFEPKIFTPEVLETLGKSPSQITKDWYSSFDDNVFAKENVSKGRFKTSESNLRELEGLLKPVSPSERVDKVLSESKVARILEQLVCGADPEDNAAAISSLKIWLNENLDENCVIMEAMISKLIDRYKVFNISTVALLAEMIQKKDPAKHSSFYFSKDLIKAIEYNIYAAPDLMDQIALLNRLNDEKSNMLMHKFLDFFRKYLEDLQKDLEDELDERNNHFYVDFHDNFIEKEAEFSKNYLVKKHFEDLAEMLNLASANKDGALHGIAGGNSDEMIYQYSHLMQSYKNRRAYQINESFPAVVLVLPVAPDYLGIYKRGQLQSVFQEVITDKGNVFQSEEEKQIKANDKKYDYIYDVINEPVDLVGKFSDPSKKLQKLNDIWDFQDKLEKAQKTFYFDLSRVDINNLHPVVVADLLNHNQKILHGIGEDRNDVSCMTTDEFMKKLSTQEDVSESQFVQYINLTKLHMRKKIEDEFGIDIAELDFAAQRQFLDFLSTRDVENVEGLKGFAKKFKINGLKSFLALESGQMSGEDIILIGNKIDEDTQSAGKLFEVYANLVDRTALTKTELEEMFKGNKKLNEDEIGQISSIVLDKANALLFGCLNLVKSGKEINAEELLNELEDYDKDLILTAGLWKALAKSDMRFEDLAGAEFEKVKTSEMADGGAREALEKAFGAKIADGKPVVAGRDIRGYISSALAKAGEDKKLRAQEALEMVGIYEKNYADKPEELREEVVSSFVKRLISGTDKTNMYVYKKDGQVLAFNRFDDLGKNKKYFGSFNVAKNLQDSAIGSALLYRALEEEGRECTVEADCSFLDDAGRFYIEKCGFVAKKVYEFGREPSINIERSQKDYYYKDYGNDDLIMEHERNFAGNQNIQNKKYFILKFPKNSPDKIKAAEELLNDGKYVMTRYFNASEGKGKNKKEYDYCAFEKAA